MSQGDRTMEVQDDAYGRAKAYGRQYRSLGKTSVWGGAADG